MVPHSSITKYSDITFEIKYPGYDRNIEEQLRRIVHFERFELWCLGVMVGHTFLQNKNSTCQKHKFQIGSWEVNKIVTDLTTAL